MSLKSKCVGYWNLNGDSTDLVAGNNGSNTAITWVNAKVKQGASFNGTSSGITIPSTVLNFGAVDFGISLIFNTNTIGSPLKSLFSCGAYGAAQSYFLIYIDASGQPTAIISSNNDTKYRFFSAPVTITTGVYYILTCSYDSIAKTFSISINNTLYSGATTVGGDPVIKLLTGVRFGFKPDGFRLNGILDEIGIYNAQLTASEIGIINNSKLGNTYPFNVTQPFTLLT